MSSVEQLQRMPKISIFGHPLNRAKLAWDESLSIQQCPMYIETTDPQIFSFKPITMLAVVCLNENSLWLNGWYEWDYVTGWQHLRWPVCNLSWSQRWFPWDEWHSTKYTKCQDQGSHCKSSKTLSKKLMELCQPLISHNKKKPTNSNKSLTCDAHT